jgi:small ligand-binding sensory domain FIST
MPFASALSQHPDAREATGEVIGAVVDALGTGPDLAVLFATPPHRDALADVAAAVRSLLEPATLIGTTASAVVAGDREVEDGPALVLWAGRLSEPATPVRLEAVSGADGWSFVGMPLDVVTDGDEPRDLVLLTDPFSFPADALADVLAQRYPRVRLAGGLSSGANGPGGNRLLVDGRTYEDGAVGALMPAGALVTAVVSQGCKPVGDPMVVTRAERNVVFELAGKPALERLTEVIGGLTPDDRQRAERGIHLGRVVDERKERFETGDFLIRNVLGGDRRLGALAIGDHLDVGATVQFQVRDAESADLDLRHVLAGRHAGGALLFTCTGRGSHLFGRAGHDAELVDAVTSGGTAGMFCAGELGPVGGRTFLHGFTASVVLFHD